METRNHKGLELRKVNEKPVFAGYAAVFNSDSRDLGGFIERIKPGAFKRTLAEGRFDLRALVNHDRTQMLARQSAGTLRVVEDETGLAVEIDCPDTTLGRDTAENVRNGNYYGMSFQFRAIKDTWTMREKLPALRELLDVDLQEVSIVDEPAYEDTSVAVRCYTERQADHLILMKMRLRLVDAATVS